MDIVQINLSCIDDNLEQMNGSGLLIARSERANQRNDNI